MAAFISKFRSGILCLLMTALAVLTGAWSSPVLAGTAPMAERVGFFFDTVIQISLYDTGDESILDACFDKMSYYESIFSRTREGSDVWNINHSKGAPVEVSPETIDILEKALAWCEASGGALDITIAPVVDLWDFHEDTKKEIPGQAALEEAVSHVDYHSVTMDGNVVTLADPEAGIDLGAVAKGYISDRLRDMIIESGCGSALISLGGNVMTVGGKPDGKAFNVGIRRPFGESQGDLIQVVSAAGTSVITSGTYERFFEKDGVLYHHILDPATGAPVSNGLTSVTILSEDGTAGDALSTACFVMGPDQGMELIENLDGVEAMMIDDAGVIHGSSGWTGRDYP